MGMSPISQLMSQLQTIPRNFERRRGVPTIDAGNGVDPLISPLIQLRSANTTLGFVVA